MSAIAGVRVPAARAPAALWLAFAKTDPLDAYTTQPETGNHHALCEARHRTPRLRLTYVV